MSLEYEPSSELLHISGVWSEECGVVWSVECGVWSVECGGLRVGAVLLHSPPPLGVACPGLGFGLFFWEKILS